MGRNKPESISGTKFFPRDADKVGRVCHTLFKGSCRAGFFEVGIHLLMRTNDVDHELAGLLVAQDGPATVGFGGFLWTSRLAGD